MRLLWREMPRERRTADAADDAATPPAYRLVEQPGA